MRELKHSQGLDLETAVEEKNIKAKDSTILHQEGQATAVP